MPSHNSMVGLLKASVIGHSAAQRSAARILLDAIRSSRSSDRLAEKLEVIRAEEGLAVAAEASILVEEYGLGGPSDLLR